MALPSFPNPEKVMILNGREGSLSVANEQVRDCLHQGLLRRKWSMITLENSVSFEDVAKGATMTRCRMRTNIP